MKSFILFIAFALAIASPVWGDDYIVTTNPRQEWALTQEALEQGKTQDQLIQEKWDEMVTALLETWAKDHERKALDNASPAARQALGLLP